MLEIKQNPWAAEFLKHCLHDGFVFADKPHQLTVGFHCSCAKGQLWEISLGQLKSMPTEVHALVQALRKAKLLGQKLTTPNSDAFLSESLKRLRKERRRLERQLAKKMRHTRRIRLKEKLAHVDRLMVAAGSEKRINNEPGTIIFDSKGKLINETQ